MRTANPVYRFPSGELVRDQSMLRPSMRRARRGDDPSGTIPFRSEDASDRLASKAWNLIETPRGDREAEELYLRALRLDPDNEEAHNGLGSIYGRRGELHAALTEFRIASALNDREPTAPFNQGLMLLLLLEQQPEHAFFDSDNKGWITLRGKKARERALTEASEAFERSLALSPNKEHTYFFLAQTYAMRGLHLQELAMFRAMRAKFRGGPLQESVDYHLPRLTKRVVVHDQTTSKATPKKGKPSSRHKNPTAPSSLFVTSISPLTLGATLRPEGKKKLELFESPKSALDWALASAKKEGFAAPDPRDPSGFATVSTRTIYVYEVSGDARLTREGWVTPSAIVESLVRTEAPPALPRARLVRAYHGGPKPIRTFVAKHSAQGVFWFSEDKERILCGDAGAISTAYLTEVRLQVRFVAGRKEYDRWGLGEIESHGYDSIHLEDDWVIFDPKHIEFVRADRVEGTREFSCDSKARQKNPAPDCGCRHPNPAMTKDREARAEGGACGVLGPVHARDATMAEVLSAVRRAHGTRTVAAELVAQIRAHRRWVLTSVPLRFLSYVSMEKASGKRLLRVADYTDMGKRSILPGVALYDGKGQKKRSLRALVVDGNHRSLAAELAGHPTVKMWMPEEQFLVLQAQATGFA